MFSRSWRMAAGAWGLLLTAAVAGCAVVPRDERLLSAPPGAPIAARNVACGTASAGTDGGAAQNAAPLHSPPLRVVSWNLHKGEDAGWQLDLERYARLYDLLLLQEAVLTQELRDVIEKAGHHWQMTGAFSMDGIERGVMIAARTLPIGACTLRSFEPLFPIPKSAMVVRYRLAGSAKPLAVANLHGINFTLGLGRFTEQMQAVADELKRHDGPAILGGDFNTWSEERHQVMLGIAAQLGMTAVIIEPDGRRRHFGQLLDHFFVRGLKVMSASSPEVKSSDHNPILVELANP